MLDYRNDPENSPLVWSPQLGKLVPALLATYVMKTVFYVSKKGVFPYGVVDIHALEEAPHAVAPVGA